jgi:hypothetical protein
MVTGHVKWKNGNVCDKKQCIEIKGGKPAHRKDAALEASCK